MQKQELKNKLIENHQLFIEYIHSVLNEKFEQSNNDKWTPGQQLEHILLSVKPLRQILTAPKVVLSLVWGRANRESKTYEELIAKYNNKLQQGGSATARFVPNPVRLDQKTTIAVSISNEINIKRPQ